MTPGQLTRLSGAWTAMLLLGLPAADGGDAADPAEIQSLVEEAYIYGLPMLMSYKTMYFYSVDESSPEYKAAFNQIKNIARVYGPEDTAVVSPNSDTPYSLLWMDLRAEPVVLSVPAVDEKRYYSVMLQDLSTNLLPYIGSRTTGNGGGTYMIAGAGWRGGQPEGIDQVMVSQTDFVFAVYRTQLFDAEDIDEVKGVQSGYGVTTLSGFLGEDAPPAATKVDFMPWDEAAATGDGFISYLNFLLPFIEPDEAERALLAKLAPIGVGAGRPFDLTSLSEEQRRSISAGVQSAIAKIDREAMTTPVAGHSAEDYDHDWLQRAVITQVGWGANDPREASYPAYRIDSEGDDLDGGKHDYTLTFAKDALPPVRSFWSVTMYDGQTQLMIENPLDRYLVNSPMLPDLRTNEDGSLTIYIQKDSPGKRNECNWLPAPDGPFYMLLRLYWPSDAILEGSWMPPAVRKKGS